MSGYKKELERRARWDKFYELERNKMRSEEDYAAYEWAMRKYDNGPFAYIPDWLQMAIFLAGCALLIMLWGFSQ